MNHFYTLSTNNPAAYAVMLTGRYLYAWDHKGFYYVTFPYINTPETVIVNS